MTDKRRGITSRRVGPGEVEAGSAGRLAQAAGEIQRQVESGLLVGMQEEGPTPADRAQAEFDARMKTGRPQLPEAAQPPNKVADLLSGRRDVRAVEPSATVLEDIVVKAYEGFRSRGYDRGEALQLTNAYAMIEAANLIADLRNTVREALR